MITQTIPIALFRLGRIMVTSNARATLSEEDILLGIQRHQAGNWGNLSDEDCQSNNRALEKGGRIFSAYTSANGLKYWVITEADRSVTTVLLPEDY